MPESQSKRELSAYERSVRALRRGVAARPRPEHQRSEVLRLRSEGMSLRAIAQATGIPRATVGEWARGIVWEADERRQRETADHALFAPVGDDVLERLAKQTRWLRYAKRRHDMLVEQALRAGYTEHAVAVAAGLCDASAHYRKVRAGLREAA